MKHILVINVKHILVIKLSALGDFVLAMGPFAAIRRRHAEDHVTLLTTAPFVELARMSGYFDDVWIDERPAAFEVRKWMGLRRRLRSAGFARVYDLQTSDRSGMYYRLFGKARRPEWSGIAPGCSHPHANPNRDLMHTVERQIEQLALAGIPEIAPPDLSWLDAEVSHFELARPFVLLVPGGAAHRPEKRWPAGAYAALARRLQARGVSSVMLGTETESAALAEIAKACPEALNLGGRTSFAEIAGLARRALAVVGNDTGPMHLSAALGCPSIVLFSAASDPDLSAPRGSSVTLLRDRNLSELGVERVIQALRLGDGIEAA